MSYTVLKGPNFFRWKLGKLKNDLNQVPFRTNLFSNNLFTPKLLLKKLFAEEKTL